MNKKTYQELFAHSKNISVYSSINALLNWDQETYMPQGAIDIRSAQISLLSKLIHKEKTNPSFAKNLFSLISEETGKISSTDFNKDERRVLELWREDYIKNKKLPEDFVEKFSEVTSRSTQAWIEAKQKDDFQLFSPHLEKVIELSKQKADLLGYQDHPYDALIDTFEPGMDTKTLDTTFSYLKKHLTQLLTKIEKKPQPEDHFIYDHYEHADQLKVSDELMKLLHLPSQYSRLDESAHPFTLGIHPQDTRFTTWVKSNNVLSNIFGTLHEAGHGLYELGLPMDHYGTPICEAASIGIHESQSRFFETFIGKSQAFWKHFYPILQQTFSKQLSSISFDSFYKAVNIAKATKIRVEADELTYCLHIILRFELEKQIISGELSIQDIPEAWKDKAKELLHLEIKSDAEGCLQDIHWSMGGFGYFPTYALGNIYAAQMFEILKNDLKNWEEELADGSLSSILDWMKVNVHQRGRYYLPEDLVKNITKKELSSEPYAKYLEQKFSSIYGV